MRNKVATRKTLEKIVGALQSVAHVIWPGKAFIRSLEQMMHLELKDYDAQIRLDQWVLDDLKWWLWAMDHVNGIPLEWVVKEKKKYDEVIWTDAATTAGLGGCSSSGRAFQIMNYMTFCKFVSLRRKGIDISFLEFLAVFLAAKLWAPTWKHKIVKFYCDNPTVAGALINKRAPLNRFDLNFLVKEFAKLAQIHQFRWYIVHVKGAENEIADSLSRFKTCYKHGVPVPMNFEFESFQTIQTIVNQVYSDVLKLPLNYDDEKRLQ